MLTLESRPPLIDPRFRRRPRQYTFQAILAAVALGLVIFMDDALSNAAILTGIASTAFIIFTIPHTAVARTRRVIGGHSIAVLTGLLLGALVHGPLGQPYELGTTVNLMAAAAVGISMLVMAATDTEHPPAAGTALGLVIAAQPLESGALVLVSAVLLAATRLLIGSRLINLAEDGPEPDAVEL